MNHPSSSLVEVLAVILQQDGNKQNDKVEIELAAVAGAVGASIGFAHAGFPQGIGAGAFDEIKTDNEEIMKIIWRECRSQHDIMNTVHHAIALLALK